MRTPFLSIALVALVSCASVSPPPPAAPTPSSSEPAITALAFSKDRATLWYAKGDARCQVRALTVETKTERGAFELERCPASITVLDDETLILTDGARWGQWKRPDGSDVVPGSGILAAADASNYVVIRDDRVVWKRAESETELGTAGSIRSINILPVTGEIVFVKRSAEGERVVRVAASGENDVSAVFSAIDSIGVAPRGDEVVFSARRENGFDVAIASTDGKKINWIAPDPADEVGVSWAPRGNKVTYLIRGLDSTLVRSVHVPTAFQLTFDTPFMTVRSLAWESRAERIAMIVDGPAMSPHIDWIEYGGANRATLVAARESLNREPERVAFGTSAALLLPPATVRYGQKLPLFVRLARDPLGWAPDLRDLEELGGGLLVVAADSWGSGDSLEALLKETPWADPEQLVVIDLGASTVSEGRGITKGRTLLTTGTKQGGARVFSQRELPAGGTIVAAENWQGAMTYLRERFSTRR